MRISPVLLVIGERGSGVPPDAAWLKGSLSPVQLYHARCCHVDVGVQITYPPARPVGYDLRNHFHERLVGFIAGLE